MFILPHSFLILSFVCSPIKVKKILDTISQTKGIATREIHETENEKFVKILYDNLDKTVLPSIKVTDIQRAVQIGGFERTRLYFVAYFETFAAYEAFFAKYPCLQMIYAVGFDVKDLKITADDFVPPQPARR